MRLTTVLGARPQFVKAAPVSRELKQCGIEEALIHTGQHYDPEMSGQFFEELQLPDPDYHLGVGSGTHGVQTARMMQALEDVLLKENPDAVLVYGDTNSTLAGALVAAKMNIPVAHVEAGLRSFNRAMPEEINRIVADHLSSLLLAPTKTACENLRHEGFTELQPQKDGTRLRGARGFVQVGDVMKDALLALSSAGSNGFLPGVEPKQYYLASMHRPANVDEPKLLEAWLCAFMGADLPIILPLHPRTRAAAERYKLLAGLGEPLRIVSPLGYVGMITAIRHARAVLTDSGGVQKEAFMLGVPCVTLRAETEWLETLEQGWNQLCPDPKGLWSAVKRAPTAALPPSSVYGDGKAAMHVVNCIQQWL